MGKPFATNVPSYCILTSNCCSLRWFQSYIHPMMVLKHFETSFNLGICSLCLDRLRVVLFPIKTATKQSSRFSSDTLKDQTISRKYQTLCLLNHNLRDHGREHPSYICTVEPQIEAGVPVSATRVGPHRPGSWNPSTPRSKKEPGLMGSQHLANSCFLSTWSCKIDNPWQPLHLLATRCTQEKGTVSRCCVSRCF